MKTINQQEPSGKGIASVVSVVGLVLVWGIVWANLPSKDELLSAQSKEHVVAPPVPPELDLTIPGVPPAPLSNSSSHKGTEEAATVSSPNEVAPESKSNGFADDMRARQIAEVKCEAEVQQVCPDSLTGEDRRRCVAQRMRQLAPVCQQIIRQQMVRWKEAEGYKVACLDDVKRMCRGVQPGEGRIRQCLQEHAQEISERCYQTLPKGQLLLRN